MGLRKVVRVVCKEMLNYRTASKTSGGRNAVVARARSVLGVGRLDDQLASVQVSVQADVGLLGTQIERATLDVRNIVEDLGRGLQANEMAQAAAEAAYQSRFDQIEHQLDQLARGVQNLNLAVDHLYRRIAEEALANQVQQLTAWIRQAILPTQPLISIVLATRDREPLLARAIGSVMAQEYTNWQLVIVDDGSSDGTNELLQRVSSEDDRIVVITQSRLGSGSARNKGLSAARGEFICYLDDDNLMQPLWLKAVAWAAERQPDLEVLYGARIMDAEHLSADDVPGLPHLQIQPFDRIQLETANYIDLGVLAHRRDLPEASFDESLDALGDWDLILRLTAARTPTMLPVVALHYTTTAPDRISRSGGHAATERLIREKLARERPLRVLAYNSLFPLVPETYIADEARALTDNGAVLAWCCNKWSPSPVRIAEPIYLDLQQAVTDFHPDVLLLHWASFAEESLDKLTQIGVPFAVRAHSFDFNAETIKRLADHPLCIGVWAFPHHAGRVEGAHPLVSLLTERDLFTESDEKRTIVLSASAGLPKKDWPTLVSAFADLARNGADCRIIVGLTDSHADEPQIIRDLITEAAAPIMLSVDVPHDQVIALLVRTAVVVYSKRPGGEFGMPRSIIEGMYAGTSVIMPDRPESVFTGGPGCRTYRRSADIVRHATEVLSGGPRIEAERQANRQYAARHFADPALAASFAAELRKAWVIWQSK